MSNMDNYNKAVAHVIRITGRPVSQWTYHDKSIFQSKMITLKRIALKKQTSINRIEKQSSQLQIPQIIIQPNLNTDPCMDDIEPKTDSTPGMIKVILIGVVIGIILGVIK